MLRPLNGARARTAEIKLVVHFFALLSVGMLAKPPSKCLTPLLKILGEQLRLQLSKQICTLYTSLSFLQVQQVLEDVDDFAGRISLLGALDIICLLGGYHESEPEESFICVNWYRDGL